MRDWLFDGPLRSRIAGRAHLVRRLRLLLVAVNRFARGCGRTREDVLWAAKVSDGLTHLLEGSVRDAETKTG